MQQGLVADLGPICGEPTVPASLLRTVAGRAAWPEISLSPGADGPAVKLPREGGPSGSDNWQIRQSRRTLSCVSNWPHINTTARTPRQARAPRPKAKAGSCDPEAACWRCGAE